MQGVRHEHLFVYGTLQRGPDGSPHPYLTDSALFLGVASCRGKLYMLDGYPGLVLHPCGDARVWGELYRLLHPESVWQDLDRYEECDALSPLPHPYARRETEVQLTDGRRMPAWTYAFVGSVAGRAEIPDGRFSPQRPRGLS